MFVFRCDVNDVTFLCLFSVFFSYNVTSLPPLKFSVFVFRVFSYNVTSLQRSSFLCLSLVFIFGDVTAFTKTNNRVFLLSLGGVVLSVIVIGYFDRCFFCYR